MKPQNRIGKWILLLSLALPVVADAQTNTLSDGQTPKAATPKSPPLPKWKLELEAKLDGLIFPKIEFKDARLADVVKFLGDYGITIVLANIYPRHEDSPTIALNMRNAPLRDVLRRVTDIAGLKFVVDSGKIMIVPCDYSKSPKPN